MFQNVIALAFTPAHIIFHLGESNLLTVSLQWFHFNDRLLGWPHDQCVTWTQSPSTTNNSHYSQPLIRWVKGPVWGNGQMVEWHWSCSTNIPTGLSLLCQCPISLLHIWVRWWLHLHYNLYCAHWWIVLETIITNIMSTHSIIVLFCWQQCE